MKIVPMISARMSLRKPQRESLELLESVLELFDLSKDQDVTLMLEELRKKYPDVTDFEREFPSICFAIATGVGKTRLMGAFITYLFLIGRSQHFFILAPNLTIYEKLISDFSPSSPKYVFKGIAEFVNNPPVVITGDNYENGRGVRQQFAGTGTVVQGQLFASIHVNIFNISKINTEVRGGAAPRIKRLQEYIGQSYFEYLASLNDLVLIMDEAHRYRATAGAKAINELKPILGIELTATPQVESGSGSIPFKNVIYQYPLSKALQDGYVKDPAVATRKDFKAADYSDDQLERIKLEDGIHNHESVKVELEIFARNSGQPLVKPFMLVIAQDITHASNLRNVIENDSFFDGRYKGKVLEIHSNQRGEEKDENVQRLLAIEKADENAEIVIHVNKLKEGWDVTNLYTIVPLRAASSKTLVEQSIGRGLRLPYGERVGVTAVDRLTIVAHDRFDEIIAAANDPSSIIRSKVIIGTDVSTEKPELIVVPSVAESKITGAAGSTPVFKTVHEKEVANIALQVIKQFEHLPSSKELSTPEVKARLVAEVTEIYAPIQLRIEDTRQKPDIEAVVKQVAELVAESTIDVPNVVLVPKNQINVGFKDFDLKVAGVHLQPVSQEILLHYLESNSRETLARSSVSVLEPLPENYIIRRLMDKEEISYDDHSKLLYKLAGQLVTHLRSYLTDEGEVLNVLQYHQQQLGELVYSQLMANYWETPPEYQVSINKGFTVLRPNNYHVIAGTEVRDFRKEPPDKQLIKRYLFGGFKKCCYPIQKFDSDSERLFSVALDDSASVDKWMKPAPGAFQIEYKSGKPYEPDFVVEAKTKKYICEPKAADEMSNEEVIAKAEAAMQWCEYANQHATEHGGKPWEYLLIPHTAITANASFDGLVAGYTKRRS